MAAAPRGACCGSLSGIGRVVVHLSSALILSVSVCRKNLGRLTAFEKTNGSRRRVSRRVRALVAVELGLAPLFRVSPHCVVLSRKVECDVG